MNPPERQPEAVPRKDQACWHTLPMAEVFARLDTLDIHKGLASEQAASRLAAVGPNELAAAEGRSIAGIFGSQFTSLIIWLLIAAAIVSAFLAEWVDAVVIGAIVILNAVIGAFQEYSAEQAIAALRKMTAPQAKVVRDGKTVVVSASVVVPAARGIT